MVKMDTTHRHTKYLAMRTITLSGSLAMVKRNMANGGPKEMKVQPKNSMIVMTAAFQFQRGNRLSVPHFSD